MPRSPSRRDYDRLILDHVRPADDLEATSPGKTNRSRLSSKRAREHPLNAYDFAKRLMDVWNVLEGRL
jgi:hypothetical protein